MKKGFTLIELLAVIVILAIIALIATPIILNIINDSKEESNERSVELYADAVNNAIAQYQLKTGNEPESFLDIEKYIKYDGSKVECETTKLNSDGSIYLAECRVNGKLIEGYTYGEQQSKACTYVDSEDDTGNLVGSIDLSDIVTCGTESFYVMNNDGNNITMLSQYNLNLDISNPIQSTDAESIDFATSNYWYDSTNKKYIVNSNYSSEGRMYPYVYGDYKNAEGTQQNLIYPYISAYEIYLKETLKVNSASAMLMSYEQANDLMNNQGNPNWLNLTVYWLGSVYEENDVWRNIGSSFEASGDCTYLCIVMPDLINPGIRPVVTISNSEIG